MNYVFLKKVNTKIITVLTMNVMKLVEPDLIIKSVALLFATSEDSIVVALNAVVYTYVIADL